MREESSVAAISCILSPAYLFCANYVYKYKILSETSEKFD